VGAKRELITEMWSTIHVHLNQEKEVLLKKSAIFLLVSTITAILIADLSSVLIVNLNSQQIQNSEENTHLNLGNKTTLNRNHRQASFAGFQPINEACLPRTFKKTTFNALSPIQL
jgi:hypothetical protein